MATSKRKESSTTLDFPSELTDKLSDLHKSLETMEEALSPVFTMIVSEMRDKFLPLERAKIDLVSAYALNALFWIYLKAKGEKAQSHDVRVELERIRVYMSRVKAIVDKTKAPKVDAGAAKRFVRNALWTPNDKDQGSKKRKDDEQETKTDEETTENGTKGRNKKKKRRNLDKE